MIWMKQQKTIPIIQTYQLSFEESSMSNRASVYYFLHFQLRYWALDKQQNFLLDYVKTKLALISLQNLFWTVLQLVVNSTC
jgi:hypothetical protein